MSVSTLSYGFRGTRATSITLCSILECHGTRFCSNANICTKISKVAVIQPLINVDGIFGAFSERLPVLIFESLYYKYFDKILIHVSRVEFLMCDFQSEEINKLFNL